MGDVLLVDDDAKVRAACWLMLEWAGVKVVEASDGKDGIPAFRQRGTDVVLCDLFMPRRDGRELIRELRRECPGVRIIAMSSRDSMAW